MDARQIIDYAAEDNAKDFREALYASIYDKVSAHMENMKQYVAQNLVTQEEKECETEKEGHDDEKEDKALVKKMVKKDALKTEKYEEIEEEQLDELSIQTMKSAKDKLAGKAIAAHYDDNKVAARNLANRALKIGRKVDKKEWQQTNQKRLDQTAKYQKEDIEDLREAVTKVKDKSGKIIGHVEHNGDSWEHHHYGMKTSGDGYDSKKEAIESLHDHDNFFKTGKSPVSESLEEAVTRKHFQMVADLIKSHEDPAKRKELAQHHAEIFKQQNPRFDHAKFMKAAGASD